MKALKKTFSVILCLCMIMSVMAAGLNAFAQEEATAALDGAVSEAAALAVSDPTDEKPDVDAMERTKVKYPIGASKKAVNRSIGRVEDILFTVLKVPEGGVPQVLNEKVYTNETVALVAKKLFPLVGGLSSLVAKFFNCVDSGSLQTIVGTNGQFQFVDAHFQHLFLLIVFFLDHNFCCLRILRQIDEEFQMLA